MKYRVLSLFLIFSFLLCFTFSSFADPYAGGKTIRSLWNYPLISGTASQGSFVINDYAWAYTTSEGWFESLAIDNDNIDGTDLTGISLMGIDSSDTKTVELRPGDLIVFRSTVAICCPTTNNGYRQPARAVSLTLNGSNAETVSVNLNASVSVERDIQFTCSFVGDADDQGFTNKVCPAAIFTIEAVYTLPADTSIFPVGYDSINSPTIELHFKFSPVINEDIFLFFNDTSWYMGGRDNAPLYSGFVKPDSMENVQDSEEEMLENASDVADTTVDEAVNSSLNLIGGASDVWAGSTFMKGILNNFANGSVFGAFLGFSLTLGVIALVYSLSVSVVGRFSVRRFNDKDKYK